MTVTAEERGHWHAHAQLIKFTAAAERDALHTLHPVRARAIDLAARGGRKLPVGFIPHVSADEMVALGLAPFAVEDYEGNLLVNAGINRKQALLIGAGGQAYDATHCALLVGDTATAANAADTDLGAAVSASNRYAQVVDATYPSAASQVITFQATYATGNANFHWQEWGIAQNTASGANAATAPLLNHKIIDMGTKSSSVAQALRVTVTDS